MNLSISFFLSLQTRLQGHLAVRSRRGVVVISPIGLLSAEVVLLLQHPEGLGFVGIALFGHLLDIFIFTIL